VTYNTVVLLRSLTNRSTKWRHRFTVSTMRTLTNAYRGDPFLALVYFHGRMQRQRVRKPVRESVVKHHGVSWGCIHHHHHLRKVSLAALQIGIAQIEQNCGNSLTTSLNSELWSFHSTEVVKMHTVLLTFFVVEHLYGLLMCHWYVNVLRHALLYRLQCRVVQIDRQKSPFARPDFMLSIALISHDSRACEISFCPGQILQVFALLR